jgi:hypothetical protein
MTVLVATTSTASTTSILAMHNTNEQPSLSPLVLSSLRCNTCRIAFTELQTHVNEPWQWVEPMISLEDGANNIISLHNTMRHIASLLPICREIFDSKINSQLERMEESSSDGFPNDDEPEQFVFCDNDENEEDVTGGNITDNECEEAKAQLQRTTRVFSRTGMQLPSRRLVASRYTEKKRRVKRDGERAKLPATTPPPTQTRTTQSLTATQVRDLDLFLRAERAREQRVVRRDEMGLLGITTYQHRALLCAEKRAQTQEAIAMRAHEWSINKWANTQKFDLAHDRSFSKAKGGNHKMLPR